MATSSLANRVQAIADRMSGLPELAAPSRPVMARLRAGALAIAGRGLEIAAAAEATGLAVPDVALGFALRGQDGALDHGHRHACRVAIAYLVSPGAPTRAIAEELLGRTPGTGGDEVWRLATTVLAQLAGLPTRRPLPVDDIAELVAADAAELAVPGPTIDRSALARRYLGILFVMLESAGIAWLDEAGLVLESDRVADALDWMAAGAPDPEPAAPGAARLERDGDALRVIAADDVPLEQLLPLGRRVAARERDGRVELRIEPADLRADRVAVVAEINLAIGA